MRKNLAGFTQIFPSEKNSLKPDVNHDTKNFFYSLSIVVIIRPPVTVGIVESPF